MFLGAPPSLARTLSHPVGLSGGGTEQRIVCRIWSPDFQLSNFYLLHTISKLRSRSCPPSVREARQLLVHPSDSFITLGALTRGGGWKRQQIGKVQQKQHIRKLGKGGLLVLVARVKVYELAQSWHGMQVHLSPSGPASVFVQWASGNAKVGRGPLTPLDTSAAASVVRYGVDPSQLSRFVVGTTGVSDAGCSCPLPCYKREMPCV